MADFTETPGPLPSPRGVRLAVAFIPGTVLTGALALALVADQPVALDLACLWYEAAPAPEYRPVALPARPDRIMAVCLLVGDTR